MNKTQRKPPRPPMQLTCDACGKTFMRAPSKYKAKYNFCSEACAWAAHGEAVTGRAERVQILITCSIPVYPEMRPVCGRVYPAEKYKYRTNRTGYVVAVNGKRVCVRADGAKTLVPNPTIQIIGRPETEVITTGKLQIGKKDFTKLCNRAAALLELFLHGFMQERKEMEAANAD